INLIIHFKLFVNCSIIYSKANEAEVYTKTSFQIAYDGNNHDIKVSTEKAKGSIKLSFNVKENEFYPTYKYTVNADVENALPANAIDIDNIAFSTSDYDIISLNEKTGEFEINENAENGDKFTITVQYNLNGANDIYTSEISGTVKIDEFNDFNYKYCDIDGNEIEAIENNHPVWVNRAVYLMFSFNKDNVIEYKIGNDIDYINISDESGLKLYNDDNKMFNKTTELTVKIRARGDNTKPDSSGDNNNFKCREDKINVCIDMNAPDAEVTDVRFYSANNNIIPLRDSNKNISAATKKVIEITAIDNASDLESGIYNKLIYTDKEIADIDKMSKKEIDSLFSKYSYVNVENNGKAEIVLTSKENFCMDKDNTYFFYVFDNAGNYKMITYDVGQLPQIGDSNITYRIQPVSESRIVSYGNRITVTIEGSFEQFETDIDKNYDDTEAYIKFYYVKDGNRFIIDNLSQEYISETGCYRVTGVYDIDAGSDSDGIYELYVEAQDNAGNRLSEPIKTWFEVDNTAPIITSNTKLGKSSYTYLNSETDNILWNIEAVENNLKNIEVENIKISNLGFSDKTEDEVKAELKNAFTYPSKESKFSQSHDTGKYTTGSYEIPVEGKYEVTFRATDIAGNSTMHTVKFYYDKTSPDISDFSIEPVKWNYNNYKVFSNTELKLRFKATDDTSGISEIRIDFETKDDRISDKPKSIVIRPDNNVTSYSVEKSIINNFKGKLKITVKDIAGNVEYTNTYDSGKYFGIILENKDIHKLHSTVAIESNNKIANVYNGVNYYGIGEDINLKITGKDDISGINYILLKDNDTSQKYEYTSAAGIKTSANENYYIKADKENEGTHVVRAKLKDNAGNTLSIGSAERYVVDVTKPKISCTYSANSQSGYFNGSRMVKISIIEENFDNNKTVVTVTKNGNAVKVKGNFDSEGNIHTMTYVFSEDADYVLDVTCEDKAGNVADIYSSGRFTVDSVSPIVDVSYDNNVSQNDMYYKKTRTATIKITEHNFDPSGVEVIIASEDDKALDVPVVSSFTSDGDMHTATVKFDKDGTYKLSVKAKDKSNNSSDKTFEDKFTIDLTEPEIEIVDLVADTIYTEDIAPIISITDENYDKESIKLELKGTRANASDDAIDYTVFDVKNGEKYVYANFKFEETTDDCYKLSVTAVDLAGNVAEKEVEFKVDRYGSYFVLGKSTQEIVDKYYTNLSDNDIVIEEYNVADIKSSDVYYMLDGNVVQLNEKDYTVKADINSDGWFKHTFIISAESFKDDGIYNVIVHTNDAAGKETDNEVKSSAVKFCIDRTAPEYYITGVENDAVYERTDAVNAVVSFHDNIALEYAEITLDGDTTRYDAKDLEAANYEISLENIKASDKKHILSVVCFDVAGNKSEQNNEITFTVSNNALQTVMAKTGYLFWIILVIVLLCVSILILLIAWIIRKRYSQKSVD
ncbi:MAG: Ig-like domain-containing protein, partial [Coprococcus sp.]